MKDCNESAFIWKILDHLIFVEGSAGSRLSISEDRVEVIPLLNRTQLLHALPHSPMMSRILARTFSLSLTCWVMPACSRCNCAMRVPHSADFRPSS